MLIDTHAHLINENYDIDETIEKAKTNNVLKIIVSGSDLDDNFKNIKELGSKENVFFTCGFHPEFADKITDDDLKKMEEVMNNQKVVGVGEIGLDYHYSKINKEKQKELFKKL